ncbi:YggT family protein [Lichenicola cladoniae]|uniref:YggT family protein n=1 Tax=Lichenicola cladoniae TaxID=1484109 RepID=UPI001EF56FAB|nr:YggT family protein [Lichenicola cladoniae]
MITAIFALLYLVIRIYVAVLLISCLFSLLFAFGVLDNRNRLVRTVGEFLYRATEPVLAPVRRILPQFGNVDLSPLVVLLVAQYLLVPLLIAVETAILTHSTQQFFS